MALLAQLTAMLLFLALLLPAVLGQLHDNETVQCYSSAANCTSDTNGTDTLAIDCCNGTDGGYIRHSSLAAQCGACVVVGFDQSRVHIGPSDAGRRYSFTADVLLSTPDAPDVTDLDYVISREPAMLVDVSDYLSSDFTGRTNGFLPERFSIRYVSQGNAVALQPTLSFDYLIAVETGPLDRPIPSGAVLVYRRLSIMIDDIDIITIGLEEPSMVLEGSDATANVVRQVITYEAPFEVTVSNERYTGTLTPDEAAVGDFDRFNFTEQRSVVFQPTTAIDQRFERVTFSMPRDNIVELQEIFRWRLSVNDSRVRLDPLKTTQIVRLDNQDVFSIGFRELQFTLREGEAAPLTIKQIGNETGGLAVGGFPEVRLQAVDLRQVSGTAINGSDFFLADTAPRFTYRANNTLNDTFTPITTFDDDIIEGDEKLRVIITPGGDNVVQVQRDFQTATITILDDDFGVLSLERGTYDVIENEGTVEICVVLTGGVLSENTTIDIRPRDGTAQIRSDYSTRRILPLLVAFTNRTCGRFDIINDTTREQLFENFTVSISNTSPENNGLTIDRTPSFIRIQDDDQAEVRFAMGQATFSEGGGNQSITVILGGAQLSQEQTIEVYIDDGTSNGISLGNVTFGTNVITQNRSISFPVVDNNIALEPDKHYLLRLKKIDNIGLGNPGTMNITIVDDDDVSVSFVQSSYSYSESHGTVSNIQVQLSNPIAQDLSVNIRGGPGSQSSSVVVSGVDVNKSISFIAGGSRSVSLSNFDLNDDAFALEAVEQYDLSLINHDYTADESRVSLGSDTTLSINDDDVVDVTFSSPMYSFFENGGMAQVSVSLSRNISQALTVTVRTEGGSVNQNITFSISQRVGFISFGLNDDLIALEDPERFQLRFSQHSFPDGSKVRLGPSSQVSIFDDDVVSVTFAQSSYSYFESNGTVSNIMLRLNTTIARPLSVLVSGGPGSQPSSVVVSGANVSSTVTFAANSSLTESLPSFVITNDDVALETVESYSLSISNPSVTQNVVAADSTGIAIRDDDVVTVEFENSRYLYSEDEGTVDDIMVTLDKDIATDLTITYAGGPGSQPSSVRISGADISGSATFTAFGSRTEEGPIFSITDDSAALETDETYQIRFTGPTGNSRVRLGSNTTVVIDDNDVVNVTFSQASYSFAENVGMGSYELRLIVTVSFSRRVYNYSESHGSVSDVIVRLSAPISKDVPVQVIAEPMDSQTVVESGSRINQALLFRPGGASTMNVPFGITDDNVGLETLESYPIIFNTSFNTGVNYGLNSRITITDDDDVNVMFVQGSYSYSEGDGSSSDISVRTNRPFAQDIIIGVSGGPGNQPSTVESSGFNVSQTLTLTANTAMAPTSPVGTFTIRDDSVALETEEQYSLGLSTTTTYGGRVTVGGDAIVSINDDDSVSVSFQGSSYTYPENHGTVSDIILVANTTVAQNLVVTVSGGPGNQPSTVVPSGANVSSVVTFTARGSRSERLAPFTITDDSFALETNETYQLSVSQAQPNPSVGIGPPTTINIVDDEVLRVTFGQGSYNATEGDGNRMLQVMISNPIVQDFTVTVNGSSGPQPFVVNNGPSITQTITFNSRDRTTAMVPFDVGDDAVALENTESYTIGLSNPSQPGVNIASSTEIRIADNDVPMVGFERDTYSFLENAGTTMAVTVVLSNEVIRPFTVRVVGAPDPVTPGNSGTPVNQVLGFAANDNSSANLRQIVPVTVIDDSISGEAVQTYPLNFTDVPQDITIGSFRSTNIVIIDDDESVVRIIDGDKTVLESDGSSVITVVLTGANSDIVSVDILNSTGGVVGTATFLSSQDVTAQTFNVTVNYLDDNVALEPNEMFTYTLGNLRGEARVGMPNTSTHTLVDDDRLTVQFVERMYTFNEPDGAVSIAVNISNPIAQGFTISTGRIIETQPFVIPSGPNFSDSLVFTPTGPMAIDVNGIVTNDMIALEDVEMYRVQLSNLNISSSYITVGAPTNVRVISEDVVNVTFATGNDFFEFDQPRTEQIAVSITSPIARQLDVNISSVYQPDPLVEQSGMSFTTQVSFVRGGSVIDTFNFPIGTDDVAFEAVEREVLSFTGSSPSAGVNFGPNTEATITDRDVVGIMFVDSSITVLENSSMVTVQLMRSNPIRQNVTVRVLGGPNRNQLFVDTSGTDVDRFVTFSPNGPDKQPLTFQVTDDQTGLEDLETYFLNLTSSIPTTRVNLGSSLRVNIMDNDIVGVNFNQTSYDFDEDDGAGSVQVVIDRPIARDLTVPVRGAPGTQPSTVFISGTNVNSDVTFSAGGVLQMTVSFPINDDSVALEDVESYPLRFGSSTPSGRVTTGAPTTLRINDDDPFFFGFRESNRTYPENGGSGSFTFVSGPAARPVTFDFTQTDGSLMGINESLFTMVCGTGSTLTVPSSPSETPVVCLADIRDDSTALENDERSSIRAVPISVTGAEPVNEQFTAIVIDDDVPGIFVTPPTTSVVEGGSVRVCVESNVTSLRPIDVTLSTINGTATGPPDFVGGSAQLTIPAGSRGPQCAMVRTLNDTESEGNETFSIGVTNISTRPSPNATNPQTPVPIGGSSTSTVTIIDTTPESRRCELRSSTRRLTTFRDRESYIYNGSCERSLVAQRTSFGDFAVVVDSLDGSFMTTRLGVRLGREVLVVNAFNRTIIRQENLNRVAYSSMPSELRISVADLDVQININDDGIDINIGEGSDLDTHTGLCGNRNGMLVYRNGTVVPDPDSNINRLLGHYTTPPSETFVRTIARRQCGLLGEDSETGDPMFTVPLYTPDLAQPHTYSLCYEIHGSGDQYYNFISDGCTSVNGHYFSTDDPDDNQRDFHGVDRIRIRAVNKNQQCVDISVILGSDKLCTTSVGSNVISSYDSSGITVSVDRNTTRISVPNCADAALEMTVHCNVTPSGIGYQEFRVIRGLNLNEDSHGIIGQFWNVETQVTKYNGTLRDGTVSPNAYRIDVKPRNKPQRSFVGFLEPVTWDFTPQRCLYAGNSQGGAINEVIEDDLNHSLLEGDYRDYQMESSFDTEFRYGHFESNRC
uniref:Calx-beta domain-containing protein n=1 Tax=Amphimedon queenslandica TaxID=400682 RepID=A0A1X7VF48_AMPQE